MGCGSGSEQLWPPLRPRSSEAGSGQLVEERELARELGVCSAWPICSSPTRAIISASVSQVEVEEEQAWDDGGSTEAGTEVDITGGGSSSLRGSIA